MMRDEDLRRRCLFNEHIKEAPKAKVNNKRRRAPAGAHIGFELARAATKQTICCGACGEMPLSQHCPLRTPRLSPPAPALARSACSVNMCLLPFERL